ncbi:MAG: hypothetical protein AB1414_18760 [bacterium]
MGNLELREKRALSPIFLSVPLIGVIIGCSSISKNLKIADNYYQYDIRTVRVKPFSINEVAPILTSQELEYLSEELYNTFIKKLTQSGKFTVVDYLPEEQQRVDAIFKGTVSTYSVKRLKPDIEREDFLEENERPILYETYEDMYTSEELSIEMCSTQDGRVLWKNSYAWITTDEDSNFLGEILKQIIMFIFTKKGKQGYYEGPIEEMVKSIPFK